MNGYGKWILARAAVFLIALSWVSDLSATPLQWDPDGVAIRQGAGIGTYSLAQNSSGQTLVVWADLRNGSDDIFAQLLSPSGLPMWEFGGRTIVEHPAEQVNPVAVAVSDGWILFWIDHRYDSGVSTDPGYGDIYAQKINRSGVPVWNSVSNGGICVDVYQSQVLHYRPLVAVADQSGGAMVAWADTRTGYYESVLVQRVDAWGSVSWNDPVTLIDSVHSSYDGMAGIGDNSGNLFVASHRRDANEIVVAKIAPNGQLSWGRSGVRVTSTCAALQSPCIAPDLTGGCVVGWVDRRETTNDWQTDFWNLYAQHVNDSGAVQWTSGGIPVCIQPHVQHNLTMSTSWNGSNVDGWLFAWEDRRLQDNMSEIYAQKISMAGTGVWESAGVLAGGSACADPDDPRTKWTHIVSDRLGGAACCWTTVDDPNVVFVGDVYAARIAADGTKPWGTSCTQVYTDPAGQFQPKFVAQANGLQVYWINVAGSSSSIRTQRLDWETGSQQLPAAGEMLCNGICGAADSPRSLHLGGGRVAVLWSDTREWIGRQLYYQIMNSEGEMTGPVNGQPLTQSNVNVSRWNQGDCRMCVDGEGGFYVLYEDATFTDWDVLMLAHINSEGNLLSQPENMLVTSTYGTHGSLSFDLIPDGVGGCYVAYQGFSSNAGDNIFVQRVNEADPPEWPLMMHVEPTVEVSTLHGIFRGENNSAIVVWTALRNGLYRVKAASVRPDGSVAWRTEIGTLLNAGYGNDVCSVVSDGEDGIYCVMQDYTATYYDPILFAHRILANGQRAWDEGGISVVPYNHDERRIALKEIALDSQGDLCITWFEDAFTMPRGVYMQKLSSSGAFAYESMGRLVVPMTSYDISDVQMQMDGAGGAYFCWTRQGTYQSHIFGTHVTAQAIWTLNSFWQPGVGGLISTSWDQQYSPVMCADGKGGAIVVYVDFKGLVEVVEPPQIYAQRIFEGSATDAEEPPAVAAEYSLNQNFPNPFNPSTNITFELAHAGHVALNVYDIQGRKVASLLNESLSQGAYQVHFDGANLPSGTYIYRLQSEGFSQSRKMLLLK